MRAAARFLAAMVGIGVAVFMALAGLVRNVDGATGVASDGLSRALEAPPWWARLFLTDAYEWAGFGWMVADAVVVFGGVYVAFTLYSWGADESGASPDNAPYEPSVSDLIEGNDRDR